jgi:hypothetical protein
MRLLTFVIAGLDPAIHPNFPLGLTFHMIFTIPQFGADTRVKPASDDKERDDKERNKTWPFI